MTAPVKAGDLRHRITIETASRVSDGAGGASITWNVVAEVSAAIWTRTFDILGVIDPDDRGRWLKCPVLERDL